MNLTNLRTFYFVTIFSSFTKTAQHLQISQPAVTLQIKNLETELAQPLFKRCGRKIQLTPQGKILETYAKKIFSLLEEAEEKLQYSSPTAGALKVAGDINFLTSIAAQNISQFYAEMPNTEVQLIALENSKIIFEGVKNKNYDIGIISGEYYSPAVECIHLSDDPIILVAAPETAKKYRQNPAATDIPVIVYESDSSYSTLLHQHLKIFALANRRFIRFNSLEAVKSSLLHNAGIAIITKDIIRTELYNGKIVRLDNSPKPFIIPTYLTYLKTKKNLDAIQRFKELCQKSITS